MVSGPGELGDRSLPVAGSQLDEAHEDMGFGLLPRVDRGCQERFLRRLTAQVPKHGGRPDARRQVREGLVEDALAVGLAVSRAGAERSENGHVRSQGIVPAFEPQVDAGIVVASLDTRGQPGPASQDVRLGILGSQDDRPIVVGQRATPVTCLATRVAALVVETHVVRARAAEPCRSREPRGQTAHSRRVDALRP